MPEPDAPSDVPARPTRDAQLNVYNVAAMLAAPPDRFDTLRVDSNNDCNVQCVYCHNQHEPAKMRDAGLTHLAVSIDAADPQIHKARRGGTSLSKVVRNLERLMPACPSLQVGFITTVSRHNLEHIPELVQFGLNLGGPLSRALPRSISPTQRPSSRWS
jgi:MoaA/NifB/PqqE/SkfB family radical SAM enzyme